MTNQTRKRAHPAFWVPSLYFAEGLPYNVVNGLLAVMYKNLGVSNADIALHVSLMVFAWTFKPLWSPVVEMFKTKRHWVLAAEYCIAVTLGCVALALPLASYMPWTLALMWIVAFTSATHDIASDGLYISVMSSKEQSAWVGVQGFFWTLSKVLMTGSMVVLSGYLHDSGLSWPKAWVIVMCMCGAMALLIAIWHTKILPQDIRSVDTPTNFKEAMAVFKDSLVTFFQKKDIWKIILFIGCYKCSQGLVDRVGPLFLLDKAEVGGLALSNQLQGSINGTWGTAGIMVGTLLAGLFVSKFHLHRATLMLLCMALNIPNSVYIYLSHALPTSHVQLYFWVLLEKFGMGFGEVGLLIYMMQQVAPGKYRTAHYAFATGLMNLGYTIGGIPSGWIQEQVGYVTFFIFVMFATIPSFLATWFAPFNIKYDPKTGKQIDDPAGSKP